MGEKKKKGESAVEGNKAAVVVGVEYEKLDVGALQRLEEVRDRTIGWILKEIEKVEEAERNKEKSAGRPEDDDGVDATE